MILRILTEGQYTIDDPAVDSLNALDEQLVAAIEEGDSGEFEATLQRLLDEVRNSGERVPDDYLGPSDLVLPAPGATLEEVRDMLGEEGLIPG
jgi:hypothetical protein